MDCALPSFYWFLCCFSCAASMRHYGNSLGILESIRDSLCLLHVWQNGDKNDRHWPSIWNIKNISLLTAKSLRGYGTVVYTGPWEPPRSLQSNTSDVFFFSYSIKEMNYFFAALGTVFNASDRNLSFYPLNKSLEIYYGSLKKDASFENLFPPQELSHLFSLQRKRNPNYLPAVKSSLNRNFRNPKRTVQRHG